MKIRIDEFRGLAPKIAPANLPEAAGQESLNLRMNSTSLAPINSPSQVSTKTVAGTVSVYMHGTSGTNYPLTWATDVDVAPSPISDNEYKVYYTGDGVPKKTNKALAYDANPSATSYPVSWYHWGVPAPTVAPTLGSTTGSVPAGTYAYVFTYVTQFGSVLLEESAPSPAGTITLGATGGVTVTFPTNPSTTNRNYVYKRVYRTTGTTYQMVAQVTFASASFTDNLAPTAIPADALITSGWLPPKDDLKGVCTLPGGAMAGFRDNEIWFCEPGYPHAWPAKYMQTVDDIIVGIKTYGNNLVVCTQSFTHVGTGLHPETFTFRKLPMLEPITNKRSLASDERGVLYASANGIVVVGDDMVGVASAPYLSRDTFAQYNPSSFSACVYERRYYAFYNSSTLGKGAFVFARGDEAPITKLSVPATAVTLDRYTARMYFVSSDDNKLYWHDPQGTVPYTYTWKSKLFQLPAPANLACFRVVASELTASDAEFQASIDAQNAVIAAANATVYASGALNQALGQAEMNALPLNGNTMTPLIPGVTQTIGVTVWGGRQQILSGDYNLNTVYRLPSGFRALSWEIGVTGQREVYALEMASSVTELKGA